MTENLEPTPVTIESTPDFEQDATTDLFTFNTAPVNTYNAFTLGAFGKLPETLKLQSYDSYLPDLKTLLKIEKDSESRAQIFKKAPKIDKNLPKCIDFDDVKDSRELSMSKTMLMKRKKAANKAEGAPLKGWFGLGRPEVTAELEQDLKILKLRGALDPKRFYKKDADKGKIPLNFAVGTIVDSPLDRNKSLTKKERKRTIVGEILADEKLMRYQKKRVMAQHNKYAKVYNKFDLSKHRKNLKKRKTTLKAKTSGKPKQ